MEAMGKYHDALRGLNAAQRLAVETIDGPVLVIAGPGTGKTQLLATRIAHILSTTDTLPENILCLTFTESAAQNMRERLASMIGQAAHAITISTYHAFGSDLIRRFPDYFATEGDLQPVDDLGIDQLFREIVGGLPYGNPLKYADNYLGDVKSFVSDVKRALLTPDDLRAVARANDEFIAQAQPLVKGRLNGLARITPKSLDLFVGLLEDLAALSPNLDASANGGALTDESPAAGVTPLAQLLVKDLHLAIYAAQESGKTAAITKWKNAWLAKDNTGAFIVDGQRTSQKLLAAADVYETYLHELAARRLFDYDDMILRAVHGLQTNDDLRFTVQEQYLYILLDEFQDTNGAQLRLVELLTDNPVMEGRPNVLAVGDDDQAIYAFQGADYSHMLQFQRMYRDVLLVPLTENYRSHHDVLHVARGVAEQIEERLHHHFPQIEKTLVASNTRLPKTAVIERREAKSDVAQFAWTAQKIRELVDSGVPANEIAVLAPQHKYLVPLVPFLQQKDVSIRYDKRENILDEPAIIELLRMSELCLHLANGEAERVSALWSEILSFRFWQLPTSLIWKLSWEANDKRKPWSEILLEHDELKPIALFFARLSMSAATETLETMLDYLIGVAPLDLQEPGFENYTSPFYAHYFGGTEVAGFWDLLTSLTILRTRLRDYKKSADPDPLNLADFIGFVEAHRAAEIKVLNTSPYQDGEDAVQLMTAFKAKGMEFSAVFVLAVNDEAWGTKARSQSTRLSLPQNLQFIRYAGATNDERLRLFYVAITRAKTQLYLVNYQSNFAGRHMNRLAYLDESSDEQGITSPLLPEAEQQVLPADSSKNVIPTTELSAFWQQRHQTALTRPDAKALLHERLQQFQLSPTHVNAFVDVVHAGPAAFFLNTILRFPTAPSPNGQFGNAMHETLEWLHMQNKQHGAVPSLEQAQKEFAQQMRAKRLSAHDTAHMLARGDATLKAYLEQRSQTISATNESEYNFRNEGVFIGAAHMSGKIDKLIVDRTSKTLTIVDFKTGKSYSRWEHDAKLHKYRQQLYLYRALVENSRHFAGYRVTDAYLEFVEPDDEGVIRELHLNMTDAEHEHNRLVTEAVWNCVQKIELPDVSTFSADVKGIELFEQQLVSEQPRLL